MWNWNFNKKGSASPFIKHTQLSLELALASTVHKVQVLSLEQGVVGFDVLLECECLKQNDLFSTIKRSTISVGEVAVLAHNVRSHLGNVDDSVSDNRFINNNIIGFTETKIKP